MKTNRIELHFDDNSVPSLAGYKYGENVFIDQAKKLIDYEADVIEIVFPDDKTAIASSFIEGFLSEIVKNIGLENTRNKLKVCSSHQNIVNKIKASLM